MKLKVNPDAAGAGAGVGVGAGAAGDGAGASSGDGAAPADKAVEPVQIRLPPLIVKPQLLKSRHPISPLRRSQAIWGSVV